MLRLKKSTSFLGDALQTMRALPEHSMDACIVDPPYNMSRKKGLSWAFSKHVTMQESWDRFSDDEYLQFCAEWLTEVCRVVRPNGNLFIFGSYHNIYQLGFLLQRMNLKILNSIVWMKPNAQPNITCRMLTESTEQVVWACNESKEKATGWTFNYAFSKTLNEGKQLRNLWTIPVTARSERVAAHPSQKPEVLMERLVLLFTKKGDWILDPFAGVGTTGIAALRHDRNAVLIENQSRYFEAQKKRFKDASLTGIGFQSYPAEKQLAISKKLLDKAATKAAEAAT